ncbi:endocuticle structural glycoprotein SgAbd-1 [Orussus abietinus]|uniref:endocuticle structural glycoprotein SgAbd-1 n=1 Tax=Orussus abietinus TaxID=222816 RepID=UPI000625A427|nr:endocuticle structural glycoprotein SgAbd-1 [Orussus abietinus]
MRPIWAILAVCVAVVAAEDVSQDTILSQEQDQGPDGSFRTKFETSNGISVEEYGSVKQLTEEDQAQVVQGSASWVAPDGTPVQLSWVADENGANFQGSHLPVAPPAPEIPVAIQRALKYIEEHPYKEPNSEQRV